MRKTIPFYMTCAFLGYASSAWAEQSASPQETQETLVIQPAEEPTMEERLPANIIHGNDDQIVTLGVENDLFGGKGTDNNYTSGVRLTYYDINADMPRSADTLNKLIPFFDINETTGVFYSLGQNIYTPSDIKQAEQDPDDRPWAAHLYGSMGLVTVTDNRMDEIEASIGVIGPPALGEQAQKFVHQHVTPKSPTPRGWDNQLDFEPALLLGWQRSFPQYFHTSAQGLSLAAAPYYGGAVGNIHTFGDVGINFRLTPETEKWQDAPVRVRPAPPGTGFFEIPVKKWSWYLFAGVEGRAVARNIFLDGNTFGDSHSVDKKYFVADTNAGLALTYDRYRISYTFVHRTEEFRGQDEGTTFGALSVGYRF